MIGIPLKTSIICIKRGTSSLLIKNSGSTGLIGKKTSLGFGNHLSLLLIVFKSCELASFSIVI